MIINVRGTHGSGKTTVVRRVLDEYRRHEIEASVTPVMIDGRKRPFGYKCRSSVLAPLLVLGSYENATGGCDTISEIEVMFDALRANAEAGGHTLFEGIVAQHSATRLLELNRDYPVEVVVLQTPLEIAIESVRSRRAERGADVENFDPRNVIKEYKSVLSSSKRLEANGMKLHKLGREEAYQFVIDRLSEVACAA